MEAEPLSEITGAVGPGIVKSSAKVGGASGTTLVLAEGYDSYSQSATYSARRS